jgi:hypothetical protein
VSNESKLRAIKILHTFVWAIFAGSIIVIPWFAFVGGLKLAWGLVGFVAIEVVVLFVNRMRCPLTDVAERYTPERQDHFDIYLPLWLARYNKQVFGTVYAAGVAYTLWRSF